LLPIRDIPDPLHIAFDCIRNIMEKRLIFNKPLDLCDDRSMTSG
jgi:hypothetical protein